MVTDLEIAWAAGIFEGEGNFGIRKTTYPASGKIFTQVVARLAMCDEDVVLRFFEIVGVGHLQEKGRRTKTGKPVTTWAASSLPEVLIILEMFRPWLGKRRLARIEEILGEHAEAKRVRALLPKRIDRPGRTYRKANVV